MTFHKFKKAFSVITGMALILTMSACGSSENATSENVQDVTKVNANTINLSTLKKDLEITSGGEYTITGTGTDKYIHINVPEDDKVTVVLDGVNLTNTTKSFIYVESAKELNLEINGENTITDTRDVSESDASETDADTDEDAETNDVMDTIEAKCDIDMHAYDDDGSNSLTLSTTYNHAIKSSDDIKIKSGDWTISSNKDSIHANGNIDITGGTLNLASDTDEAIQAKEDLTVDDGTIHVTEANEGITSKATLTINGGTIDVTSSDDSINAGEALVINDGNIKAVSTGNDALDSNGTIEINGGYIVAYGLTVPEGAYDNDSGEFTINGGTVIGIGSVNSEPNSGSQHTVLIAPELDSDELVETVEIKDSDGNSVFSYEFDDYSTYQQSASGGKNNQQAPSMQVPNGDGSIDTPSNTPSMQIQNNGQTPPEPPTDGFDQTAPASDAPSGDASMQNGNGFNPSDSNRPSMQVPKNNGEAPEQPQNSDFSSVFQALQDLNIDIKSGNIEETLESLLDSDEIDDETKEQIQTMLDNGTSFFGNGTKPDGFGHGGGGFSMSGSPNLFISIPELTDGTYTIYVNGEKEGTIEVTADTLVYEIGNISTMGGMPGNNPSEAPSGDMSSPAPDMSAGNGQTVS